MQLIISTNDLDHGKSTVKCKKKRKMVKERGKCTNTDYI